MRGFVRRLERGHERGVEDAERERQARAGQRTPRDVLPLSGIRGRHAGEEQDAECRESAGDGERHPDPRRIGGDVPDVIEQRDAPRTLAFLDVCAPHDAGRLVPGSPSQMRISSGDWTPGGGW